MSDVDIKKIILEFIKNRTELNESTASRHIHRRFDIPMDKAEEILKELSNEKIIEEIYDKEYQENRFNFKNPQ